MLIHRLCFVAMWALVFVLGFTGSLQSQTMTAGIAKGVITNDTSRVMVNGRMSEGTKEDIHARVLVLNDGKSRLIFVTYDLNCLDVATPILRQKVKSNLKIDSSRLILLATHNHNAPQTLLAATNTHANLTTGKIVSPKRARLALMRMTPYSKHVHVNLDICSPKQSYVSRMAHSKTSLVRSQAA